MAAGETFRSNNLLPGFGLGENVANVSLSADDTQIFVTRNAPFIRLTSNSATATARTFSLTSGPVDGYLLKICLVGGVGFAAELLNTGNVLLTGTWTAAVGDYLTLQWDAITARWRELARGGTSSTTTSGIYTPTMTVGANVVSASALQGIYQKVGNVVYVSGASLVTCTAATNTASQFFVSLPIASNLATAADLSGNANRQAATGTAFSAGTVQADFTNDRAQIDFNSSQIAAAGMVWTFSYLVI
jgi:hypothetical protein